MSVKKLMRFYFSAGSLDGALNNLITRLAVAAGGDAYAGCEPYAEKIAELIEVKERLGRLWARLDGILGGMTAADRAALKRYGAARGGCADGEKRERHRAVVKFTRRAGRLLTYGCEQYKTVCAYYCLINPAPD